MLGTALYKFLVLNHEIIMSERKVLALSLQFVENNGYFIDILSQPLLTYLRGIFVQQKCNLTMAQKIYFNVS